MKQIILITLAIVSTACGGHTPALNIESKYQPYVNAFESRSLMVGSNVKVTDLTIESVPSISEPYTVAKCLKSKNNSEPPRIIVSQEYWVGFDVQRREETLFHEMGHCVLGREHRPDQNNLMNLSIMNPHGFSGSGYVANYDQYMHELFFQKDLVEKLPLLYFSNDSVYNKKMDDLFALYDGTAAKVSGLTLDETAPSTPTLSEEELNHLGCGE
jgi:hypothetical protein